MTDNGDSSGRLGPWLGPMLVILVGGLAYIGSFSGAFVFDDVYMLKRAAAGGCGAWFTWRPVADATFALNYAVGGASPVGYHLVNLVIHLMCALVLYRLVVHTILLSDGPMATGGRAYWMGLACSVVWVCHPLTTAAVTYISQRYESLMSLFYVLTLYCVLRGERSERRGHWYMLAVLCCLLGMGSKEVMVTVPAVVLLYDWVFLSRGNWRALVKQRWGLYAALAGTWLALGMLMSLKLGMDHGSSFYVWSGADSITYAATELTVLCRYLRLAVWPSGLCFDYVWPMPPPLMRVILCAVVVGVLGVVSVIAAARGKWVGFLGCSWFIMLSPTSGFIPRPDPVVEHRMYLPLAAVVVAVVLVVGKGLAWLEQTRGAERRILARRLGTSLFLVSILALTALTAARNGDFRSEEELWRSVVLQCPANLRARLGVGAALLKAGKIGEGERWLKEVLCRLPADEERMSRRDATIYAMARSNMGWIRLQESRYDAAELEFREALRLAPDYQAPRRGLDAVHRARQKRECPQKKEQPRL